MSRTTCTRPLGLLVASAILITMVACGGKRHADDVGPDAVGADVPADVERPDTAEPSPDVPAVDPGAESTGDAIDASDSDTAEPIPDAAEPDTAEPIPDTAEPDTAEPIPDTAEPADDVPGDAAEVDGITPTCVGDTDCDDGDPCTDDVCDATYGCLNVTNTAPCDDGDACTEADACFEGLCLGSPVIGCGEPACGDGICEPGESCAACPADCSPLGAGDCAGSCDPTVVPPPCTGNRACLPTVDGLPYVPALTFGHGVCGVGCTTDADCPGGACLSADGLETSGVCAVMCQPGAAAGGDVDDEGCGPSARCVARADDATAGVCVPGRACQPGPEAPECVPLHGLADAGAVLTGCFAQGGSACPGLQDRCLLRTAEPFHAGTCVGQATACDAARQLGCDGARTCTPLAGPGLAGAAFVCADAPGTRARDEACADAPEACAPGLLCHGGACRAPCVPGDAPCAAGTCRDLAAELLLAAATLGLCEPGCGDGTCDAIDSAATCPADCADGTDGCGDGSCDPATEGCLTCPLDCGACVQCGDGSCVADEACGSCAADCGPCPECGDGACTGPESCDGCPTDCGVCVTAGGVGTCSAGESCYACPADCGACTAACGDGACGLGEGCVTCPADCGACPWTCGDGACSPGETCASCPADCRLLDLPGCGGDCDPTGEGATCDDGQACVPTLEGQPFAAPFQQGNGVCAEGCPAEGCGEGRGCLAFDGLPSAGVCGALCTPPDGPECEVGGACVALTEAPDTGVCVAGPACDPGTGCAALRPGSACLPLATDASRGVCLPGCWGQDPSACQGSPARCLVRTDGPWHQGTCAGTTPACDAAAQVGCTPSETCLLVGGAAFLGQATVCVPATGASTEGGDCTLGADRCAPGLWCVDSVCRRPCRPNGPPCTAGSCDDVGATFYLPVGHVGVCR